ncbi:hypothetical protein [Ectobacillus ponti]|uniref:Uncharacterized protein n=1 Tax=Ectobacillus ponti TaxID=2961894 RepID=A0AA41X424_9BACI|nr:hypothetical protein [Ectobacillus ponti]MCP8968579.1 hypothetical protein [Ectobacillus ponti]
MGNNQDPHTIQKQHANGIRDKGPHIVDNNATIVPNTRTNSEMFPPKHKK